MSANAVWVDGARTSTKWGKFEPVSMPQSKTDHWSKMKHQSTTFSVKMPQAFVVKKLLPPDAMRYRVNADGTVEPLTGAAFDDEIVKEFGKPGTDSKPRLRRSRSIPNMTKYRNPFNDRAREGFKFWPLPRPKPTLFGKYGMGGYKSVLGLGDAVRT